MELEEIGIIGLIVIVSVIIVFLIVMGIQNHETCPKRENYCYYTTQYMAGKVWIYTRHEVNCYDERANHIDWRCIE
jgi:hypothetical protein